MYVKICGITNLEDARMVVDLGARALGFVLAPSKRRVTQEQVANIIAKLAAGIDKVGVFVDASAAEIVRTAALTGLAAAQLHGATDQASIPMLDNQIRVIQVIKVSEHDRPEWTADSQVWKILLDTQVPGLAGGSGKRFNWTLLDGLNLSKVLIAGGITADNVAELLDRYQPFGVDLSSGVEAYPGKKDPNKLKQFFRQMKKYQ